MPEIATMDRELLVGSDNLLDCWISNGYYLYLATFGAD